MLNCCVVTVLLAILIEVVTLRFCSEGAADTAAERCRRAPQQQRQRSSRRVRRTQ